MKKGYTYSECITLLNGKSTKVLSRNTTIIQYNDESIYVELHGSPIVILYKTGMVDISLCGYNTVTTRRRINQFLKESFDRIGLFQKKGAVYLSNKTETIKILNSARIYKHGDIITR